MFFSKKNEKKEKKPTVSIFTMVSFAFIYYTEYLGNRLLLTWRRAVSPHTIISWRVC